MKERMYRMIFEKKEFNALMDYLEVFEDDIPLFLKIKKYATVAKNWDGSDCISVLFFGDELCRLCNVLMQLFPEINTKDYFTPIVRDFKVKKAIYRGKKEGERQALHDGIKRELLHNPNVTGSEIAQRLNVPSSRVYAVWGEIRAEIARDESAHSSF